jgi:NTP pyrophosphatase (non-canonical NTP hydrolase)
MELGLPEEVRREVFEKTFPELAHINESSSRQESIEAWKNLQLRLRPDAVWTHPDASHINILAQDVHEANKKWWIDIETGEPLKRNKAEMMMLIVSEIAEAMEGHRKNLPDDKLPHRPMEEVEMADALIRILDYCAGHGLDLGGAYVEKMAYNAQRADHSIEERKKANGKKF